MGLADLAVKIKLMHEKMEVAKTLAAETASEGEVGMRAGASVIYNRSVKKGKTPFEIITDTKSPFYGTTNKNRDKLYQQVKPTVDKIVDEIYQGKFKDTVGGAEYIRQPTEKIRKWHGEETVRIGNHIFHKERVK